MKIGSFDLKNIPGSVWFMLVLLVSAGFLGVLVMGANNKIREDVSLPITVEEFFDYQCSHCVTFHAAVQEAESRFGDKIEVVYRHFPIPVGEDSIPLAYGAEAARVQGKFNEFHDAAMDLMGQVYAGSLDLEAIDAVAIAELLELDIEQFKADMESPEVMAKVESDKQAGVKLGVRGTPTFFVEGQKINSNNLLEDIQKYVDLAESKK